MKTLEQLEAEAEVSFALIEAQIEGAKALIECIEMLTPKEYLEINK